MTIRRYIGGVFNDVCLTGDCQFRYMPADCAGRTPQTPVAFSAPHHGARTHFTAADVPMQIPSAAHVVSVSVGTPNRYRHPVTSAGGPLATYATNNYTVRRTDSGGPPNNPAHVELVHW